MHSSALQSRLKTGYDSPVLLVVGDARLRKRSNGSEANEADVTEDADSKVVAEGLADLDAVAHAKVLNVVGLHCTKPVTLFRQCSNQTYAITSFSPL